MAAMMLKPFFIELNCKKSLPFVSLVMVSFRNNDYNIEYRNVLVFTMN